VSPGVADDRAPDPGARHQLRHRRQHRPGSTIGPSSRAPSVVDVVHHAAAVEAGFVGETAQAAKLADGCILTELEPDRQRSRAVRADVPVSPPG
jgi:hypothetical protein